MRKHRDAQDFENEVMEQKVDSYDPIKNLAPLLLGWLRQQAENYTSPLTAVLREAYDVYKNRIGIKSWAEFPIDLERWDGKNAYQAFLRLLYENNGRWKRKNHLFNLFGEPSFKPLIYQKMIEAFLSFCKEGLLAGNFGESWNFYYRAAYDLDNKVIIPDRDAKEIYQYMCDYGMMNDRNNNISFNYIDDNMESPSLSLGGDEAET